jgi:hypothetical protein
MDKTATAAVPNVGTQPAQDMISALWATTEAKQKWHKESVKILLAMPNLKEELNANFKPRKLRDDDEVLYNWFIGTAFRICINDLKHL